MLYRIVMRCAGVTWSIEDVSLVLMFYLWHKNSDPFKSLFKNCSTIFELARKKFWSTKIESDVRFHTLHALSIYSKIALLYFPLLFDVLTIVLSIKQRWRYLLSNLLKKVSHSSFLPCIFLLPSPTLRLLMNRKFFW